MNKKSLAIFAILFSFSLLAASCKKPLAQVVDWPEVCQETKAPPESFTKDLVYPGSRSILDPEGEPSRYPNNVILCTPQSQETTLAWYKEKLTDFQYNYQEADVYSSHTWLKDPDGKREVVVLHLRTMEDFTIITGTHVFGNN